MAYFDLNKIEQILKDEDLFSDNLSNKGDSLDSIFAGKVEAQKFCLNIGDSVVEHSRNVGSSNQMINGEIKPVDPFADENFIGPTDPNSKNTKMANGQYVWNFLTQVHKFTAEGAAGVIGNLMQESGINPRSTQYEGGPGRGIMQWTLNERWASLIAWTAISIPPRDPWQLQTQLEYMIIEMKRYKYERAPVYDYFRTVTDYKKATYVFERVMERAGKPEYEKRYNYAANALKNYRK